MSENASRQAASRAVHPAVRGAGVWGAVPGAAIAALVTLGVSACHSSAVPAAQPAASTAASSAQGGPAPASPRVAGKLTGSDLRSVLLPQSYFPPGYTLFQADVTAAGNGATATPVKASLASVSCDGFDQRFGKPGFGETAMAAEGYSGNGSSRGSAFTQIIYQFATPTAAKAFASGVQSLAVRCLSFTVSGTSGGTLSMQAQPAASVAGRPAFRLTQTGTLAGQSVTIDELFAQDGPNVLAVAATGSGASAPSIPALPVLLSSLRQRLAAAAR
jgi:hypothetical protein